MKKTTKSGSKKAAKAAATTTTAKSKAAAKTERVKKETAATIGSDAPAVTTSAGAKKARASKAKGEAKPKRVSALDAAAQVLAKAKEPMGAKALIEAMAEQTLWKSPGGATPWATLYAAMLREIGAKGQDARFTKVDRGLFAFNG
jgi:hypothetical protein